MIGVLPPRVPATNCTTGSAYRSALAQIDYCRAREGVGPLTLPGNFGRLTVPEQLLALINLERINRGLPPDLGLNATLNRYAQAGAAANTDPAFPSIRRAGSATRWAASSITRPELYDDGGSIWAENGSILGADLDWMYVDGAGAGNDACSTASDAGCWGHRGIILSDQSQQPLVGGGGYSASPTGAHYGHSYAFEQLYGFSTSLVYRWNTELPAFTTAPTVEPLTRPTVTAVSPKSAGPRGGSQVTLTGTNLVDATSVSFGSLTATAVLCTSETRCVVKVPAHAPGSVSVTARNPAGGSATGHAPQFSFTAP